MEIALFLVTFILLLALSIIVFLYVRLRREKKNEKTDFEPTLKLTVVDVLKLANYEYIEHLDLLVQESNIESKSPAFFEKYQELNRENKERYFQDLLEILSKDKREWVNMLLNDHPDIATHEIILLILMDAGLDNKTMARILFVTLDTLKKRKSRLKQKVEQKGIKMPG